MVDAGEDASQVLLRLLREYGFPLVKRTPNLIKKTLFYTARTGVWSAKQIADIFRDTKKQSITCDSETDAKMRKLATIKTVRGLGNKDIDQIGNMLYISPKAEKKMKKKQKQIDKLVNLYKSNPEAYEKAINDVKDNDDTIDNNVREFKDEKTAVAAKHVYEKNLNKGGQNKIQCLGCIVFMDDEIGNKLNSRITNWRLNRQINEVLKDENKIEVLMQKQKTMEEHLKEDVKEQAGIVIENDVEQTKGKETEGKSQKQNVKKKKKKDMSKPNHDPIKSNAQVAKKQAQKKSAQVKQKSKK